MGDSEGRIGQKLDLSTDMDALESSDTRVCFPLDEDWRDELKPLRSKLEYALNNGVLTDMTCNVGTGTNREAIRCHSLILRLQSRSFDKKFAGDANASVDLPKYDPTTFRQFLMFLYTEMFNPSVEEAISLLYIAKGFEVSHLVERCSKLLKTEINVENAPVFYMKANEYGEHQLEEHAKSFIIKNADAVFQTNGFLRLPQPCLQSLLQCPEKNIDEVSAFNAMLRWAEAECDRESLEPKGKNFQYVLKGCTELIKYDQFTPEEFSTSVVDAEIVPVEECLQILKRLTLKGKQNKLPSPAPMPEPQVSTSGSSNDVFTLERFKGVTHEAWSEGGIEKISFKCNRTIQITGLGLYGRSNGRDPNVKVCVIVSTYDEVAQLESCNKTSGLPEGGGMFDINFCKPVTLNENTWYTITISMEGEMYPFGTGGKKKYEVSFGSETFNFEFKNPKGRAGASAAKGQIPNLYFRRSD